MRSVGAAAGCNVARWPNHAKMLICDERYAICGSHNWLSNAGFSNEERNWLVRDSAFVRHEREKIIGRIRTVTEARVAIMAKQCAPGSLVATVTHVRDGDTIELESMGIRLAACPCSCLPPCTTDREASVVCCGARVGGTLLDRIVSGAAVHAAERTASSLTWFLNVSRGTLDPDLEGASTATSAT
jgi:hypothetical protein